ncbi:hypothetical protein IZY60_15100 [Lutibacter sp. B2]|nr:hypothetical protein [Lutibacter sp. B2]
MKLNLLNNMSQIKDNKASKTQQNNCIQNTKFTELKKLNPNDIKQSNQTDQYSQYSNLLNDQYNVYDKKGLYTVSNSQVLPIGSSFDKGTASQTTVYVNRSAYDQILSSTTFGEMKWDEMGVDDEKRWVVVNGQRFECEHSPEEKAMRKRAQMTLMDYILEEDEKKKEENKGKDNGLGKPRGNIEALSSNVEVMKLLSEIFKTNTPEVILSKLS